MQSIVYNSMQSIIYNSMQFHTQFLTQYYYYTKL